jgi:adenine-specific DNA-methyltransferase
MVDWVNHIFLGDCLDMLRERTEAYRGKVRLIYIDPPFLSQTDYTLKERTEGERAQAGALVETATYSDKWKGGLSEYLDFMRTRLEAMKPLLSREGSIWVHLDWHVSHYAKVMLDEIYGYQSFVNEIIWRRTNSPKMQSKAFGAQHDVILIYAMDAASFTINPIYRSHDKKSLKPYSYRDERGRFRLIEIEAQGIQRTQSRRQFEWRGRIAPYLYRKETLDKWYEQNLIYRSKNGRYSKKQYLKDVDGVPVSDIWLDIAPIQGASSEYTGFLTQKPVALLKRVIEAGTRKGDLVADLFAGSGTTAVAATTCGRKWILCETSEAAVEVIVSRMNDTEVKTQFDILRVKPE